MAVQHRVLGGSFTLSDGTRVTLNPGGPMTAEEVRGPVVSHRVDNVFVFRQTDGKDVLIANAELMPRFGVMWLMNVWVAQSYRRQGRGRAVVESALAQLGHAEIYALVLATDAFGMNDLQLHDWYGRFGFKATKVPGVMKREPYAMFDDGRNRERAWVQELRDSV